jgi:hypothetical protein
MCCCTSNFLIIKQSNKANVGFVCKLIGSVDESLCMADSLVLEFTVGQFSVHHWLQIP